ncbi:MAG: hypothetical protein K6E99_03295 [Bacilli bacterium]|nr:hypothetical protein [Bacilli bacterium]
MDKNKRDKYVFVGTDYFFSSKTVAFTYLKLNNKADSLERSYITECQHEEFKNNNDILYLDENVFSHLIEVKVFDNNVPEIIRIALPDSVCRDLVFMYNEIALDYKFNDKDTINFINEDYKVRERVM